eukprot:3902720-Pyramimonas_sp.AAC.1
MAANGPVPYPLAAPLRGAEASASPETSSDSPALCGKKLMGINAEKPQAIERALREGQCHWIGVED